MCPSLPLTERVLLVPACRFQVLPSPAVPQPALTVRPLKLSWASTVPDTVGPVKGVPIGVGASGVLVAVGVVVLVTVAVAVGARAWGWR